VKAAGRLIVAFAVGAACAVGVSLAGSGVAARVAVAAPPVEPARLDAEFAEAAATLARRADAAGAGDLAATIRGWHVTDAGDRCVAFTIPAQRPERRPNADAATAVIEDEFLALRRRRAVGLQARAVAAAREEEPVAAFDFLFRAVRDDPDLARAREIGGWVRRGETWVWPEVATRLDRGEEFDPAFGWLPRGRLARYRAGERYDRGRWMAAADDAARDLPIDRGRRFNSDHWEILSTAPGETAAAAAATLEETLLVWQQVFAAFGLPARDAERRFLGAGRPAAREPFAAVLCKDRTQYVAELERLEPLAPASNGLYWLPTCTLWLHAAPAEPGLPAADRRPPLHTLRHEATHQLFAEMRRPPAVSPLAGERCGFWAIEAVAGFMESIESTDFGWTVGGPTAGRMPAARRLLLEDGFHVPLAELTALGRKDFQTDARLGQLVDEIAGLADFFMTGQGGRHRAPFIEYLTRVYAGTASADTLARLCGTSYAELDEGYRRHASR
jgi:hypothetical protein